METGRLLSILELVELAIETLAAERLFMATLFYDAPFVVLSIKRRKQWYSLETLKNRQKRQI
jgi:hypothetical protein